MKVLVTGCNGMLGTDLCKAFLKGHKEVYGLDSKVLKKGTSGIKDFFKEDITNEGAIIKLIKDIKPEIIIHTAAMTDVDGCELKPEKAQLINSAGTRNVALGAKESGSILFYISTDYVFDGEKPTPYIEDDIPNPINVYGKTKLEGEEFVKSALDKYCIIRTSWLFGKFGKNFVDTVRKNIQYQKSLKVVIDQYGSPTYTVDLADAIQMLLNNISKNFDKIKGTLHITNSDNCSWCKFAEMILEYSLLIDAKVVPITSLELDRPAKRPKMSILDNGRFNQAFGMPLKSWYVALRDYIVSLDR